MRGEVSLRTHLFLLRCEFAGRPQDNLTTIFLFALDFLNGFICILVSIVHYP